MAITMDTSTKKITCPKGDTGAIRVSLTVTDENGDPMTLSGSALFCVCRANATFTPLNAIEAALVDNTATVVITNAFTRNLPIGAHRWDIRVVTDPEHDADGNVVCEDETDEVHSLFSAVGMPVFDVTGVAGDV